MIKLYQKDVYLTGCDAEILSVSKVSDEIFDIELSQTIFFPTGGGQSCDRGTIDSKQVLDVREEDDRIYHQIQSKQVPMVGQQVHCILDWDHRFDNMQRHLGEHILSGAFYRLFGAQNKGFHMGEDSMTIDILLPIPESEDSQKNSDSPVLTMKMALEAEALANKGIWQNAPVSVSYFTERSQAESMPLRKELAFDKDISVVLVGDKENPVDCVACCGTHPSTSAQVGLIKVYKVEKNKDMYRVYFEAGKRAMENYDLEHEIITSIGNRYSSGIPELPEKLQAREQKEASLHQRLETLNKMVIASKIDEIRQSKEIVFKIDPLTINDGLRIGKKIAKPFCALHVKDANTLLLFSREAKESATAAVATSSSKTDSTASTAAGTTAAATVSTQAMTDSRTDAAVGAQVENSNEHSSSSAMDGSALIIDCNALVKASGLKGGGRKGSARAMGSEKELKAFIEQLKAQFSNLL